MIIEFTEEAVKEYLDETIRFWRKRRYMDGNSMAMFYIDAFQSVRNSLFGETLALANGDIGGHKDDRTNSH